MEGLGDLELFGEVSSIDDWIWNDLPISVEDEALGMGDLVSSWRRCLPRVPLFPA